MNNFAVKIAFAACLTASLVLAGCGDAGRTGGYPGDSRSEKILTADGGALTAAGEVDPMAAHLAARRQVDPKEINGPHRYTTTPTAEDIDKDTNVRVVRLETQVADLRSDFKKLIPNISPASEEAMAQEQAVADTMPDKAYDAGKPERLSLPAPAAAPAVASGPGENIAAASVVTGVRLGEHPDKTRIVLDLTAPGEFSYNLDNTANILTVSLPRSAWRGAVQESLAASPLVRGYGAKPAASGGVTLTVELRKPARLLMNSTLEPNEVYGHRIVFDVAPL